MLRNDTQVAILHTIKEEEEEEEEEWRAPRWLLLFLSFFFSCPKVNFKYFSWYNYLRYLITVKFITNSDQVKWISFEKQSSDDICEYIFFPLSGKKINWFNIVLPIQ